MLGHILQGFMLQLVKLDQNCYKKQVVQKINYFVSLTSGCFYKFYQYSGSNFMSGSNNSEQYNTPQYKLLIRKIQLRVLCDPLLICITHAASLVTHSTHCNT